MLSLIELQARRDELQAKQKNANLYSEEATELADLIERIALRVKYLLRYINHYPKALDTLEELVEANPSQDVSELIKSNVHSWVASRAVACKFDGEDLIVYLNRIMAV